MSKPHLRVVDAPCDPLTRDRSDPSPFAAMLADPTLHVDKAALTLATRDMQRWTRRYLLPFTRALSLISVTCIVALKRVLPFQFRAHGLIDVLCGWFMRRFVSNEAAAQLIRHFILETQLINFVLRNAGDDTLPLATLEPTSLRELASNHAVVEHDTNIYNLILDLGESEHADVTQKKAKLDFSGLEVPAIDTEPARRRLIEMDIETALYLMNIPFCLFTTEDEYERAVNSFQMDESLLACIANLTDDVVFRTFTPNKFPVWLSIRREVPRELYWHAVVNEYAHTRLCWMRDAT